MSSIQRQISTYVLAGSLILSCVGCDRLTKEIARAQLQESEPVRISGGVVLFSYTENPGAMLSVGAALPPSTRFWVFTVGVGILLVGMASILVLGRDLSPMLVVGLSLMFGGGVSNLADRFLHDGRVVDFISIGLAGMRTGVFNIADVAITCGFIIVLIPALMRQKGAPHDP
jgi:signal peptidase II